MTTRESLADQCPYDRPFVEGFVDCPAYYPTQYVPLDTHYQAMPAVWTCSHLEVAQHLTAGRHYPRCRVGDDAARRRWAARLRDDRLSIIREMQSELAIRTGAIAPQMWETKARQVQTVVGTADHQSATADLTRLCKTLLVELDAWVEERTDDLNRLGLPPDACDGLFQDIVNSWIVASTLETPQVSPASLARFPEEVRFLLSPDAGLADEAANVD